MEEEVIIPEEETFDYNKLRYILDKDGYICHASIGGLVVCNLGQCTEYNGNIPNGYSSIGEWYDGEIEKINAWKIVDGNLAFDENKYSELQILCEIQEEENKCATHKWVNDKFKNINEIYDDELSSSKDGSSLFIVTDAKEAEIASLNLIANKTINSKLTLSVTNENMLENKGITQTIDGVTFKINEDKTITLNGTSTEAIEFILNGSMTNKEVLLFLKQNTDYMECGFTKDVNLNLYYYDGTNRELVSSVGNSTLKFDETKYITCMSLGIEKGKTFKNVKISPMLTVGKYEEKKYIEYKGKILEFNFENYKLMKNNNILINRNEVAINVYMNTALFPSNNLFPSNTLFPSGGYSPITLYNIIEELMTFENKTIIQCDKDVNIEIKYFSKDYLNEKFSKIEVEQDNINIELGKKVNDSDYTGAKILLKINEDESEAQIEADKINLKGYVTLNDLKGTGTTEINGANITTGTINADRVSGGTLQGTTIKGNAITGGTINGTTISGGTINGTTINTDKDLTVGNNIYIGQNQSSSTDVSKKINLTDSSFLQRVKFSNGDLISLFSNYVLYLNATDSGFIRIFSDYISMSHTPSVVSDNRLKQEIKDIDVNWIDELKIKEFEYKSTPDKKQIGLIAQDYIDEDYSKYFLNKNEQGYYSIAYGNITNALIKYCQNLNSKIDNLEKRIKELESDK